MSITTLDKGKGSHQVSKVGQIIRKLMQALNIKEVELARQTGLPQATINRLLLRETVDPRANTLRPIARFFGVSVGQLLGDEPINFDETAIRQPTNRRAWLNVPIIEWGQVIPWIFQKEHYHLYSHSQWITTERAISQDSFALVSKAFMEPRFKRNSVMIIDREAHYIDGHFVIVTLNNIDVTVRQVIVDGQGVYLKHFDKTLPTIRLEDNHRILGTIVEARIDVYKN